MTDRLSLSALYTSPLLRFASTWGNQDLTLYVDDGCLFASGPTFRSAVDKVLSARRQVIEWLRDHGLSIDLDKLEFMFFHRPGKPRLTTMGPKLTSVTLLDSLDTGHILPVSTSLRYLGVFFTPTLDWSLHVKTLGNRACSTVQGLSLLGNSVRGFSLVAWRKLFHSLIPPILMYGAQVWFTDKGAKAILNVLQVAQNEACRKLAGVFRTTPTYEAQKLGIPPLRYRLRHLLRLAGSHLSRLPPFCAMRNPDASRKTVLPPSHFSTPSFT
jgi:hypothetical protein